MRSLLWHVNLTVFRNCKISEWGAILSHCSRCTCYLGNKICFVLVSNAKSVMSNLLLFFCVDCCLVAATFRKFCCSLGLKVGPKYLSVKLSGFLTVSYCGLIVFHGHWPLRCGSDLVMLNVANSPLKFNLLRVIRIVDSASSCTSGDVCSVICRHEYWGLECSMGNALGCGEFVAWVNGFCIIHWGTPPGVSSTLSAPYRDNAGIRCPDGSDVDETVDIDGCVSAIWPLPTTSWLFAICSSWSMLG
jgi:hypothetical protein